MRKLLTIILLFACFVCANAATPAGRLFQFERSTNKNYICYDVNLKNGALNMKEPINVYWIRAEEDGAKKELSFLQFKFAFGYKVISKKDNEVTVHLSPYKDLPIRICKRNNKWVALVKMEGVEMQLTRMFAQMRASGSLTVDYVDVTGINTATQKSVTKRINN